MASARLIAVFVGLVAVAVMLALRQQRHQCRQRRSQLLLADDEDYEVSKDTLKEIKNQCRNASSFTRLVTMYKIAPNTPDWDAAWKKCQEGQAKSKESEAKRSGKTLTCTQCPSEFMRSNKPCFKKETNECCNSKMEKCQSLNISIGRDYDCKDPKKRQCTPDGAAGDFKKYCYIGTASHNKGMCCAQPWSGTSGCKPVKGSAPAAANSVDTAAPAGGDRLPDDKPVIIYDDTVGDSGRDENAKKEYYDLNKWIDLGADGWNDKVSSIKVPSGYKATLYRDGNGTGESHTVVGNDAVADLWLNKLNDEATSMKIEVA